MYDTYARIKIFSMRYDIFYYFTRRPKFLNDICIERYFYFYLKRYFLYVREFYEKAKKFGILKVI